jgi:hypothetical protein
MAGTRSNGTRSEAHGASDGPYFEGLGWPLPLAFAGALASLYFQEGDVIHTDVRGYRALGKGRLPRQLRAIQVLRAPRGAEAGSSDADGDRRAASWRSEVTLALVDLPSGQTETRVVSQGKLAMAIFDGDEAWLDPARDEPPLPRSARELQQHLDESLGAFDARLGRRKGARFVFVVDRASDASRTRALDIEEALRAVGQVERIDLTPAEAGVEDPKSFHPAALVRCLVLPGRTPDDILPILRSRLYGGASAEPEDGEAATDRFSVARHGVLEAIPRAATRSGSSRS